MQLENDNLPDPSFYIQNVNVNFNKNWFLCISNFSYPGHVLSTTVIPSVDGEKVHIHCATYFDDDNDDDDAVDVQDPATALSTQHDAAAHNKVVHVLTVKNSKAADDNNPQLFQLVKAAPPTLQLIADLKALPYDLAEM